MPAASNHEGNQHEKRRQGKNLAVSHFKQGKIMMRTRNMKLSLGIAILMFGLVAAASDDDIGALDAKVIAAYIKRHDTNGDGKVSIDEFQDWKVIKKNAPQLESGSRFEFTKRDLNRDGYLDFGELKTMLVAYRAEQRKPESK